MEKSTAILIGRHRLTESSLIIHWCTGDGGLIKTVAKGALRPKSPFVGRLDLFITAEIRWSRSRTSDLHTLSEVALITPRLSLRESYARVLAGTYLVKLIELLVERDSHVPELMELLSKAMDYLNSHEPSKALIERFELRLAEMLGVSGGAARPVASLQALIHKTLPVQRRQLWEHFEKALPRDLS